MEISRCRIFQIIAQTLMDPTELVESRQAITGRAGRKQSHRLFISGMLLALDFRDFPPAEIAVGFEDAQEVARLNGHMLANITDENHPHLMLLSQPEQRFALPVRLQPRLVANRPPPCADQIWRRFWRKSATVVASLNPSDCNVFAAEAVGAMAITRCPASSKPRRTSCCIVVFPAPATPRVPQH